MWPMAVSSSLCPFKVQWARWVVRQPPFQRISISTLRSLRFARTQTSSIRSRSIPLAVLVLRGLRLPQRRNVLDEIAQLDDLFLGPAFPSPLLPPGELLLQSLRISEANLPAVLELAGNESVLGLHLVVLAPRLLDFVARSFQGEVPVAICRLRAFLRPAHCFGRYVKRRGFQRLEESVADDGVDGARGHSLTRGDQAACCCRGATIVDLRVLRPVRAQALAVGHLHARGAPPAADQSLQERASAPRRPSGSCLVGAVLRKPFAGWSAALSPADVPGVMSGSLTFHFSIGSARRKCRGSPSCILRNPSDFPKTYAPL